MSKSLGNIINVKDLLKKWDAEVVRLFFAQAHYRSPPDFNEKGLKNAEKGLVRIHRLKNKLENISDNKKVEEINENELTTEEKDYLEMINKLKSDFEKAMDDDFNTPQAVSVIFEYVNKSNRYFEKNPIVNKELSGFALDIFTKLGNILTLFQPKLTKKIDLDDDLLIKVQNLARNYKKNVEEENIDKLLAILLELREDARKNKDWNTADNIRKEIEEIGFEIQDTNDGPVWRKK